MITKEEMKNLAMLARIGVPDAELEQVASEIGSILGYVDQISQADVSGVSEDYLQTNVTHADTNPTTAGTYVDRLIAGAPDTQDGFYKVPKIL